MGNKSGQEHLLSDWQEQMKTVLSIGEVKKIIAKELGKSCDEIFAELFEEHYPASIGQVTKAKLYDGKTVAVKTQYPHVEKSIRKQLKLIGLLPNMANFSKIKKWGVDFSAYHQMIEETLNQELDYNIEAENQLKFASIFESFSGIKVPNVYTEYSNKMILTQEFISGDNFKTVCDTYTKEDKQKLGDSLIKSLLLPLITNRVIHSDPNPYNFIFTKEDLILLDFGQTANFNEQFVSALVGLYNGVKNQTEESVLKYFVALGFDLEKLKHFQPKLPAIAEILLRPFLAPYRFDLKDWNYETHLKMILGEQLWWFRSAGGTGFFALMKAFSNIKEMIDSMGINVYFHRILEDILKNENLKLTPVKDLAIVDSTQFKFEAKEIFVLLIRDGEEKVKLSFPSSALLDLPDYMDSDVKDGLLRCSVKLEEIICSAIDKGVKPGNLFELNDKTKQVRVWLA